MQHSVILFDGICNLCNSFVQFVIRHDRKNTFRFAALQSDFAQDLLAKHAVFLEGINTVVLIENGTVYFKSTAALRILKRLNGGWKLAYIFIAVPTFIRDAVYHLVAKKRYKWFGKQDSCMIPTDELRKKFLS